MPFDTADLNQIVDNDLDSADSALLAPGSDGLIHGQGPDILKTMYKRYQEGASLAQIRRDTATTGVFDVTNKTLENCIEHGRILTEQEKYGRARERSRQFRGFEARACDVCGDKWLTRAMSRRADNSAYYCKPCATTLRANESRAS